MIARRARATERQWRVTGRLEPTNVGALYAQRFGSKWESPVETGSFALLAEPSLVVQTVGSFVPAVVFAKVVDILVVLDCHVVSVQLSTPLPALPSSF